MINWNRYYERSPFMEGIASTFDVFGENSSFRTPLDRQNKTQYIRRRMKMHFQEVGKYLNQAMNYYDEIQKNRKAYAFRLKTFQNESLLYINS